MKGIKRLKRIGQRIRIARRIKEIRALSNVLPERKKEAIYSLVSLAKNYCK
jgi:hypothetical protein